MSDDCLICALNKPKKKYAIPLKDEDGYVMIDAEVIDSLVKKSTRRKGKSILIKKEEDNEP